ncbi:Protein of unknown function [Gryllus bimaculatus]|nr:Protein of unknown function [Gryllus bimaculatus]
MVELKKYWLPVKLWIVFNTVIFVARAYLTCMELNRGPPYPKLDIVEHVCKVYGLLVVNSYYQDFVRESTSGSREECKCHLQPDISILYIQDPSAVTPKHNQWTEQLVAANAPPLERL